MELSYEQLTKTIDEGGTQAGLELIVWALLATNKVTLTDKGKREMSAWLAEYCEKEYAFTVEVLIVFGLKKQQWLMELIREAMLTEEFIQRVDAEVSKNI